MVTLARIIEDCEKGKLGAADAIRMAYEGGIAIGEERNSKPAICDSEPNYREEFEIMTENCNKVRKENVKLRKIIGLMGGIVEDDN